MVDHETGQTRADQTTDRIVKAAAAEFAERGWAGARIERIAAFAGVSKERLYHYVGNKERLYDMTVQEAVEQIAAAEPFVADRLGSYVEAMLDFHEAEHQQLIDILLAERQGPRANGPLPGEEFRLEHYSSRVAALRAAQEDGRVRSDVDPRVILYAILALVVTVRAVPQLTSLILRADADRPPMADGDLHADLARLVDALVSA
jgi:AcrR family transcriptional regulator